MGSKDDQPDKSNIDELLALARQQEKERQRAAWEALDAGDEEAADLAQFQANEAGRLRKQLEAEKKGSGCGCVVVGVGAVGVGALIATIAGSDVEAFETDVIAPTQTIHSTVATTSAPPSRMVIAPEPRTTSFPTAVFPTGTRQWAEQPLAPRTARSIR